MGNPLIYQMNVESIRAAHDRISPYINRTPTAFSNQLSKMFGMPIHLKLENWQKTGSFKIRGALNKIMSLGSSQTARGIVTASAGNHALGVAYSARLLDVPATIFLPENASPAKLEALQAYNVELKHSGRDYDESEAAAWQHQREHDLTFVHAFDDPHIIAGQGTIALEVVDALPGVETVLVPIGGGGLISGLAFMLKSTKPDVRIIGVQSQASPAMYAAVQANKVVETAIGDTIADGLAGRFVADQTLAMVLQYVDDVVLVSEDAIKTAMKLFMEKEHLMLEGSAAVGLAYILENEAAVQGTAVLVLSGRNVALTSIREVIDR